jgi:hypothetical protein
MPDLANQIAQLPERMASLKRQFLAQRLDFDTL